MINASDFFLLHSFKLLLEIFVGHNLMVAAQGLNDLLPILIDDDRFAEIAAPFIGKLLHGESIRANLIAHRRLSARRIYFSHVYQVTCLAAVMLVAAITRLRRFTIISAKLDGGMGSPTCVGCSRLYLNRRKLGTLHIVY